MSSTCWWANSQIGSFSTTITTFPLLAWGEPITVLAWRSVLRQLVARGMLRVDMERHGALKLTETSRGGAQGRGAA